MLIAIGWLMLAFETLASLAFGVVFWRLWSRSAMARATAVKAIVVYFVGCAACLAVAMFLPI